MHWLLFYDLVDDYLERRVQLRPDHFAHAQAAMERGELLMGGALDEPADQAVLVFRTDSKRAVEEFAESDPYVKEGLVTSWAVRRWRMVLGEKAEAPVPAP